LQSGALTGVAVAAGTVTTAFAGIVTASINARGEIEQQIGGVETLFKDSADTVIKNAENAYKTAGMSATDYMQTVTSFSASLLQSLGGDTAKAANVADMALTDMSDNANKFGTSMEAIQNAYQGFAKQNYTMLDNLKLGYGGTKTEMERLLSDAQKLTGVKYDIDNLSDVYNAIHAIQENLGVTGTTAKEASSTLQGSFASMKASWDNFLSGSGDLSQLVDTATDVVGNIVRIVNEAIPDIIESITTSLPEFAQLGADMLGKMITGISTHLPNLMETAVQVIQTLLQTLIQNLPQLIEMGMQVIVQLILGIAEMMPSLIPQIIDCIILILETLLDNLDLLVEAGIELIIALAEGLIEAIPQLVSKIPQIITALIKGFGKSLGKIADIGKNLVQGLWNGINDAKNWILDKIKGFGQSILNGIKSFFGIHSPSTLFRDEIGENLGLGIGEGFEDSLSTVYKDMQRAVDYENAKLTSNLTSSHLLELTNEDNRQARLESIDSNKEIVVNSKLEVSDKVLATAVNRVNARQKLQYGIA